jgi:mono/diheme cytochrome c family protein
VESRSRVALILGCSCLAMAMATAGCSDALNAGSLQYVEADALTKDLGNKANLHGKPNLQNKVRQALANLYGPDPQSIRVPPGSPLLSGGIYLANYAQEGEGASATVKPIYQGEDQNDPKSIPQAGGYAIYRRNCVHCHGVSGAGDGPTSEFLYPRPRDYRRGIFKFTSTPSGARPHRDDLRQTITYGLHGTSMPAFEPLLTKNEIDQVIEYVMFLSMRGETELSLIEEASISDENDPNAVGDDIAKEIATGVFNKWKVAQAQVVNPPIARTPPTRESIIRGRDLFLGSDCKDCHGRLARGDGESFVDQDVFNQVVFGGNPSEMADRINALDEKTKTLWNQKPDDWGNPLRPANLNRSVYKGGRRPIDIYWRVAKGINGAQMPAHYPQPFDEKKIWDVVNFVLALPYEPELLRDAPPPAPSGPTVAAATSR